MKAKVLIVAKTKMRSGICIGGILSNGRYVRLLKPDGSPQNFDTPFEIGQIWKIIFNIPDKLTPPHIEDVLISESEFFKQIDIKDLKRFLIKRFKIWKGSPKVLFDGKLLWTEGGSGYINNFNGLPDHSVGFWISDKDLIKQECLQKVKYLYPNFPNYRITFVGLQTPLKEIKAGTLLRVSLARWWDNEGKHEPRCYLQLSGWYI